MVINSLGSGGIQSGGKRGTNPCGETVHIPIHVGKQSIWGTNPRGAWYEGSNSLINFVTNLLRTLTKFKVKVYSIKHVRLINTYRLLDVLLYNTGIYLDEYTA